MSFRAVPMDAWGRWFGERGRQKGQLRLKQAGQFKATGRFGRAGFHEGSEGHENAWTHFHEAPRDRSYGRSRRPLMKDRSTESTCAGPNNAGAEETPSS